MKPINKIAIVALFASIVAPNAQAEFSFQNLKNQTFAGYNWAKSGIENGYGWAKAGIVNGTSKAVKFAKENAPKAKDNVVKGATWVKDQCVNHPYAAAGIAAGTLLTGAATAYGAKKLFAKKANNAQIKVRSISCDLKETDNEELSRMLQFDDVQKARNAAEELIIRGWNEEVINEGLASNPNIINARKKALVPCPKQEVALVYYPTSTYRKASSLLQKAKNACLNKWTLGTAALTATGVAGYAAYKYELPCQAVKYGKKATNWCKSLFVKKQKPVIWYKRLYKRLFV